MRCTNCGNKIKYGEKFCSKCGTKINIPQQDKIVSNNDKLIRIKFKYLVIIIISIILCAVVITKISEKSFKNAENYGEGTHTNKKVEKNWYYDDENNITDGEIILHIGDFINYDEQTNATELQYISTTEKNGYANQTFRLSDYKSGWRVLGVENGQVLIVSEDIIVPSIGYKRDNVDYGINYYFINGYIGYTNGIQEINNICRLYGQGIGADKTRSITIEDVNKITGYVPNYPTSAYEYWPPTLKSTFSGEEIGLKTDSLEFELLFKNPKSNSIIADEYKGTVGGYNYWLTSTYSGSYFGGNATEYGIRYIGSGYISGAVLYAGTNVSSNIMIGKGANGIRPIIYLDKYVRLVETYEGSGIYNIEI